MTIGEALRQATQRLSPRSSTPRLDSEVLLAHALARSRASLLARSNDTIPGPQLADFERFVERRLHGEPVAYLTGHKEFYGLDLAVTQHVLVPRPETESVAQICLEALPQDQPRRFADIGTGSGAILVAVAANRPLVHAYGVDISQQALQVARHNCQRLGVMDRVELFVGNLLEPLPGPVDVIAANLPYVAPGEASPEVAAWEPRVAVFGGGEDGTAVIREFLAAAPNYVLPGGTVVMETAYSQGTLVSHLARTAFPGASVEVRKDLAGYDRVVLIKRL